MIRYPFVCVKLKSGETLFAELAGTEADHVVTIRHPMQVKVNRIDPESEGLSLVNWIPFTDDIEFDIPVTQILYIGNINSHFTRFYGSSRIKDEINKLQTLGIQRIMIGDDKKTVIEETRKEFENLIDEFSIKFGFNPEKLKKELSGFDRYTEEEEVADPVPTVPNEKITLH